LTCRAKVAAMFSEPSLSKWLSITPNKWQNITPKRRLNITPMSPALNVAKRTTTLPHFELDQYDCAVPTWCQEPSCPYCLLKSPTRGGTTLANLSGILKQLKEERAQLERQLSGLNAAIRTFANVYNPQLDQRRADTKDYRDSRNFQRELCEGCGKRGGRSRKNGSRPEVGTSGELGNGTRRQEDSPIPGHNEDLLRH